MQALSLSVVGLGKLGSPFAAVMAAKGFRIIGVDKNPAYVRAINAGKAPVPEPLLQAFIKRGRARLSATSKIEEAVLGSDITFIVVPTPSGPDGTFTNRFVLEAVKDIGKALRKKKTRHVIVVTSTVMPGSSDGVIKEAIEKASGLKVGKDVGYCYNPEFIALGSVIEDMLFPDFILIGESDARSGKLLSSVYKRVCGEAVQIERMAPVNAEITKLSINAYVTTKISYANMLADICERLPGADVDVVAKAVGSDTRVGRKYLKGATAYGGPCFPRDNVALIVLAKKLGGRADIPQASDRLNHHQTERLMRKLRKNLPKGALVGIAGMAYKPDTPVIERAAGVDLAHRLLKERFAVRITDPLAAKAARKALKGRVGVAEDIQALARHVDALVVLTPCPEFKKLSPRALSKRRAPLLVLDGWRLYAGKNLGKKAQMLYIGRG
ncbi:MAG TPA: nucleotide sugar dehydrogenase [Alphaproteobacteria bacterium]|nr:nucleotide sugar dehydrogenase [Alphaproteobacteria bacterium]